jgi:hypothetical protein
MVLLYIAIYTILCIITSVIVCHLGGFDMSDAILIGFIGTFSPIVLPVIILGVVSSLIYNKIKKLAYNKKF